MGIHVPTRRRARRRAAGGAALLALTSLAFGVSAGAQDEPPGFEAQALTPTGRITADKAPSSALAQTDPDLLARTDAQAVQVAIKLDYDSVATYAGNLRGLEATSPLVTGQELSERPSAAAKYERHVASKESTFVDALRAAVPSAQIGTSLRTVYGGISAIIPANAVEKVLAIPGAVAVQYNDLRQPLTDSSPEFVNADAVYKQLKTTENAGEGLILGNLDTGVWPEHPSFEDQGNLPPPGGPNRACNFGDNPLTPATDVFECQNKLIGGDAFLDNYFAVPRPTEKFPTSARDSNGHGTHTSSTSAGNVLENAEVFGVDRGPIQGIAPGAYVIEYKVCGVQGCNAIDSAAAVQQAILDGVDAINFSISGGNNPFTDPVELAFLDAYAAGVFVSTSAGNAGPGAGTANHLSPWVTTVAASTQTREFATTLNLTASSGATFSVDGASITAGAGPLPVVLAQNVAAYAPTAPAALRAQCGAPVTAGVFDGLIVACQRGGQARVWKSVQVFNGGGEGMVLYNAALQDVETDSHWVPTVHLPDGRDFLAFMNANTGVTGSFAAGEPRDGQGDVMATFSSRGPAGLFIKPDVTAPGVQILAGASPDPEPPNPTDGGNPPGESFQAIAGTSMSSPHVAGAGLLLKAAHPNWNPGQIKSALMTTAITDVLKEDLVTDGDPFDFGAGRIDIGAASKAPLTISDTAANFFAMGNDSVNAVHLNIPSVNAPVMPGRLVTRRVVTNVTRERQQFDVSADAPLGSTITVTPRRFNLTAGRSQTLTIIIESDAPIGEQQFGSISLVERGGGKNRARMHLPVAFIHTQGSVSLTQGCDPSEIHQQEESTCTVEAVNNSFDEQSVDLDTFVDQRLSIVGVEGADLAGPRHVRLHDVTSREPNPAFPRSPTVRHRTVATSHWSSSASARYRSGTRPSSTFDTDPFEFNGQIWTEIGVDFERLPHRRRDTASEDNECCTLPDGPDPARPNNMIAPLWTDLNGTGRPGLRAATLSAGDDDWIVVQWNVNTFGTTQQQNFQIWIGLTTNTPAGQDISFAYAPGSPGNPGIDFLVGAENVVGQGEMAAVLPTAPQVVSSTDAVEGDAARYTLDVTSNRIGGAEVTTEMTADGVPGTTIVTTDITVVRRR